MKMLFSTFQKQKWAPRSIRASPDENDDNIKHFPLDLISVHTLMLKYNILDNNKKKETNFDTSNDDLLLKNKCIDLILLL